MKRLIAGALLALWSGCAFAEDPKDVTERNSAIALMGEVLAEGEHCAGLVANVDAIDSYGHAFGVFMLHEERDNLAVREFYRRGVDAIQKFGLECSAVLDRYGPEGKMAVSLVVEAGTVQKKDWMIKNPAAYTSNASKLDLMAKISLAFAASKVCDLKVNNTTINLLLHRHDIDLTGDGYDMRRIVNDALERAAQIRSGNADYQKAMCIGVRSIYGPDGSEVPGLLE